MKTFFVEHFEITKEDIVTIKKFQQDFSKHFSALVFDVVDHIEKSMFQKDLHPSRAAKCPIGLAW